jgi:hypothetical protein
MDASVSVKAAETPELDELQQSGRSPGRLLLSPWQSGRHARPSMDECSSSQAGAGPGRRRHARIWHKARAATTALAVNAVGGPTSDLRSIKTYLRIVDSCLCRD